MYQKNITIRESISYFNEPIKRATELLSVSRPTISKVMRSYGIRRWPYRKLKAENRSHSWSAADVEKYLVELKRRQSSTERAQVHTLGGKEK